MVQTARLHLPEMVTVQTTQSEFSRTSPHRSLTFISFTSDTITVKVGMPNFDDGRDIFAVHKCVLYSDDQFRDGCTINNDKTVHLRANPEDFKTYMTWLYTRRLPEHIANPQLDTESNLDWLPTSYGLARKVGDPCYQDVLISRMIECARRIESFPNISFVGDLYDETDDLAYTPNDLCRKLMVDLWAWKCRPEWPSLNYLDEVVGLEFLKPLCAALNGSSQCVTREAGGAMGELRG